MDPSSILRTTTLLGLSTSLFMSGISFSASHLTIPGLYGIDTTASTAVFDVLFNRGALTVIPLSLLGAISNCTSAYLDPKNRVYFAIAAGLAIAPLPWTKVVMMGVVEQLLNLSKDATSREKVGQAHIVSLLKSWSWMNFVRSAMGAAGGLVGLAVVAGKM